MLATDRPNVLVIAGSDSSGGAGIVRDVATLAEMGASAALAVTAVTAQTDAGVSAVHMIPPGVVAEQVAAALTSGEVGAVKIGMLGSAEIVRAVAAALGEHAAGILVVLDPVLASSSGRTLLDDAGREELTKALLPLTTLLTPNLPEAAILTGMPPAADEDEMIAQAHRLLDLGLRAVLMKGGHGGGAEAVDILVRRGKPPLRLASPRLTGTLRGTGCLLASAIAGGLARGLPLTEACRSAKQRLDIAFASAAT
ncbi:bifunctional hydroxymethylpyrimidine kinase/phosphomethylpyrimidine kinase [Aurantimonas sp. VKM B-3413]|uniref:bifunctional hydroxymethylpyrimidine kinase/phosphomethylpyrimidine kinase n=1 Tax=Aurantimonas sp. VKM B-3413 TaxID=2779401 RepID=UPI001E5151A6|nr:bifunctional hydroxymethylpyrimidine kinase/phosphomethylpyrimidine kinase [Aurantimonas sp. VKM B-3413]MCB8839527.1 bifunctional hydroxymethylpyrimidine kinase/phosphomethylpyrimidine kinase [Aurantimonas sp. VKM B-3413]